MNFKKRDKDYAHQRMVDDHYHEQGRKSGRLVCQECGEVIPDPSKA
jgi:formylmethanofuran dehydrogenase subunit E